MTTSSQTWRRLVLAVGAIEAAALAGYGVLVLAASVTEGTAGAVGSDVSPLVLFISYELFAGLIAWIVIGLSRDSARARTPFLLTQGFGLVIAQTLLAGGENFERVLGLLLAVAAATAAYGLIAKIRPASA